MRCENCGGVNFSAREEDGVMVCSSCYTESQDWIAEHAEFEQFDNANTLRLSQKLVVEGGAVKEKQQDELHVPPTFKHVCEAFQYILKLQIGFLALQFSCDEPRLRSRVANLWRRYLRACSTQQFQTAYSDTAEVPTAKSDGGDRYDLRLRPMLSLALCYVGGLCCRLPVLARDLVQPALDGDLPYLVAYRSLPPRFVPLLRFASSALRPHEMPSANELRSIARLVATELAVPVPPLDVAVAALRIARELRLPTELSQATGRLAGLLNSDGCYDRWPLAITSQRPELGQCGSVMAALLVVHKLQPSLGLSLGLMQRCSDGSMVWAAAERFTPTAPMDIAVAQRWAERLALQATWLHCAESTTACMPSTHVHLFESMAAGRSSLTGSTLVEALHRCQRPNTLSTARPDAAASADTGHGPTASPSIGCKPIGTAERGRCDMRNGNTVEPINDELKYLRYVGREKALQSPVRGRVEDQQPQCRVRSNLVKFDLDYTMMLLCCSNWADVEVRLLHNEVQAIEQRLFAFERAVALEVKANHCPRTAPKRKAGQ